MPNSQAVRTTDKLEMFMSFPRENQKILLATNLRAKKKEENNTNKRKLPLLLLLLRSNSLVLSYLSVRVCVFLSLWC
jgi:hypothetical protein